MSCTKYAYISCNIVDITLHCVRFVANVFLMLLFITILVTFVFSFSNKKRDWKDITDTDPLKNSKILLINWDKLYLKVQDSTTGNNIHLSSISICLR